MIELALTRTACWAGLEPNVKSYGTLISAHCKDMEPVSSDKASSFQYDRLWDLVTCESCGSVTGSGCLGASRGLQKVQSDSTQKFPTCIAVSKKLEPAWTCAKRDNQASNLQRAEELYNDQGPEPYQSIGQYNLSESLWSLVDVWVSSMTWHHNSHCYTQQSSNLSFPLQQYLLLPHLFIRFRGSLII